MSRLPECLRAHHTVFMVISEIMWWPAVSGTVWHAFNPLSSENVQWKVTPDWRTFFSCLHTGSFRQLGYQRIHLVPCLPR